MLEIEDLRILLGEGEREVALVDGVSLAVAPGSVVGLAGESGSGKTLTGLSALGFFPDRSRATGSVRFSGQEVLTMNASRLRRMRGHQVAVVFQDPMTSLHPMLSVGRQLTEHVEVHLGLSAAEARERAVELLTTVRLPDPEQVLSSFPHQFSGGMRQRIAIAIALACGPELLIADEPTTALDVTVQAGILRLLDQLRQERDMGVLLISHDLGVMSALAETLHILYAGRIVESGPVGELLTVPTPPVHEEPARQPARPDGPRIGVARHRRRAAASGSPAARLCLRPALRVRRAALQRGRPAARARSPPAAPRHAWSTPSPSRCRREAQERLVSLEIRGLNVEYPRRGLPPVHAVVDVDLDVDPGQVVGLVGESGCGKSTLARAAIGLVPRASGAVSFHGTDVDAARERRSATTAAAHPDGVPGPVRIAQPAPARRPPDRRRLAQPRQATIASASGRWPRCSNRSGSTGRSPAATPTSSPAASASASPSPAPWRPTPRSSSPTRRCRHSTPRRRRRSPTSSSAWPASARPACCSSPTTSASCTTSATRSP